VTDRPKSFQGIMLSSTFTDLKEHRLKAKLAIEKLGFHAVGMESGGAQVADVIAASLKYVRDSAAYVGIITKKYGQTPHDPDRNSDERSITELEFDEAMRLGRPILLFIMADDHLLLAADVEPDPAKREKLEEFTKRAKLMHSDSKVERVWETFSSLPDFAEKVSHAIGNLAIELALEDYIARSGGLTIPEKAVRGAITRFIEVRPEAAEPEIVAAVESFETGYRALLDRVAAIETIDNRITSLKVGAEHALGEGDLDTARRLYGEAAAVAREKLAEPVRATAELLEAEASAHLLALDWEAADKAWAAATAMLAPFDAKAAEGIGWSSADALAQHGDRFAHNGALHAASARWQELVKNAIDRNDLTHVAHLKNNLGNTLRIRGERTGGETGLTLLADAVIAYREALAIYTKDETPTDWAMTHNNLGVALKAQGERTGGKTGLALLAEAVACCDEALTVYTQADMPAEWANALNNLGAALRARGERTGDQAGLPFFAKAVFAYRDALTVYTEADMPDDWAMTQNNLGNVLQKQGVRTDGEAGLKLLGDAVVAYRAALKIRTEAAMPVDWAMTQNNLGSALSTQGARTGGKDGINLLTAAIAAFRAALTIRTEMAMPAKWAMTTENLAICHENIADLGADPLENLRLAEAALLATLRVYTPEHMSYDYGTATASLARVRIKLAALPA
jgi:tetratricopeptide (TPR) repeat protein